MLFGRQNGSTKRRLFLFVAMLALSIGSIWMVTRAQWYRDWRQRQYAIRTLERCGTSVSYVSYGHSLTPGSLLDHLIPQGVKHAWAVGVPWSAQHVDTANVLPHLKELNRQGDLHVVLIFVSRHNGNTAPTPMQRDIELLRKELPGVAVGEWID